MDGWWTRGKQRNSLRSTSKTLGPQRKGQKVGRLFRTGISWDRVPHQMLTLTSGCSHLSQLLGLWAISGESQGGNARNRLGGGWGWGPVGHPRGDALRACGPESRGGGTTWRQRLGNLNSRSRWNFARGVFMKKRARSENVHKGYFRG